MAESNPTPLTIAFSNTTGATFLEFPVPQPERIDQAPVLFSITGVEIVRVMQNDPPSVRTGLFVTLEEAETLRKLVQYVLDRVKITAESRGHVEQIVPRLDAILVVLRNERGLAEVPPDAEG